MRGYIKFLLMSLLTICSLNNVSAQENSDFLVVEEGETSGNSIDWKDFVERTVSGEVGYAHVFGNSGDRSYGSLKLRFDHKKGPARFVLDAVAESVDIEISQDLDRSRCSGDNCDGLASEKTLTYEDNRARLEEGYVSFDMGSAINISAGRKKVVWGQFEPFSPVQFSSPLNLSTSGNSFSKVNSTIGQNFAALSFYPTALISFEAYYFPDVITDDIVRRRIEESVVTTYNAGTNAVDIDYNSISNASLPDDSQTAFRLALNPSWGTIAFTYFDGYDKNFVSSQGSVSSILEFSANTNNVNGIDFSVNDQYYARVEDPTLSKQKTIGLGLSVPLDRFTWKFEVASSEKSHFLNSHEYDVFTKFGSTDAFSTLTTAQQDFADSVINANNGSLNVDYNELLVALGFDAKFKKWLVNLAIFRISNSYDNQALLDLEEAAFPNLTNEDSVNGSIFPMMNISYIGDDDSDVLGFTGGLLGVGAGAVLYYNKEYRESIDFSLALHAIDYFSTSEIEETDGGSERVYYDSGSISGGISTSIKYRF